MRIYYKNKHTSTAKLAGIEELVVKLLEAIER